MAEGDTGVNALIGDVVTVLTSGTMVGPILGGAVAGYLEGGSSDDAVRVGAYSGIIALVPFLLFALFVSAFLGFAGAGFMGMDHGIFGFDAGLGAFPMVFIIGLALVYVVGLSSLGGWLGNYLKYDTDIGS